MPLTKSQAALLTQDLMLRGVIETIVEESALLRYLPFIEVVGTAVTINQEATMAGAAFYDVGDTWTESVGTVKQLTVPLRQLGGDAEIDAFLQQTYANPNDMEASNLAGKAKAVAYEFNRAAFDGDTEVNPKAFDGLERLTRGTPYEMRLGEDGGALTLEAMDEFVDLVRPGKPDAIFLSRRTRRDLKKLRRTSGIVVETAIDQFGKQIDVYDGIPLLIDDNILDSYSYGAAGPVCSRLYAVQFGQGRGLTGYENGGITVEALGPMETKNAHKWRVKWYCTIANTRPGGVAMLSAILP